MEPNNRFSNQLGGRCVNDACTNGNVSENNRSDNYLTYLIHSNCAKPFKCVIVDQHTILIYKQEIFDGSDNDDDNVEEKYEEIPTLVFNPVKIYVGKSPLNSMTSLTRAYGPEFDGNTILLDMGKNEYIHISDDVWSFDAKSKIVKFFSPIGNNDVPYPYAVDDLGNIYLLIFRVIIMYRDDIAERMKKYDDVTQYYIDNHTISTDQRFGINKWLVGDKLLTMTYKPFPQKYDREKMYIVDMKGNKSPLTQIGYVDIMKKFARLKSFEPLPEKYIYIAD